MLFLVLCVIFCLIFMVILYGEFVIIWQKFLMCKFECDKWNDYMIEHNHSEHCVNSILHSVYVVARYGHFYD